MYCVTALSPLIHSEIKYRRKQRRRGKKEKRSVEVSSPLDHLLSQNNLFFVFITNFSYRPVINVILILSERR
jgi:hypothetical protein